MHPDVYVGFRKKEEVFKEFCYTFDIFCNFYEIYEYITCEQFMEYYKGISASIIDDNYFDDVINGVWNINNVEKPIKRNFFINNTIDINNNYNDTYRKELIHNEINSANNYKLNKRYVNNRENNRLIYSHINPRNLFKIEEEEKQINNYSLRTPIPKVNMKNFESIETLHSPIKTPLLNNHIKKIRNLRYNASTNQILSDRENSKQNFFESNYQNNYLNINILEDFKEIIKSRGQKGIFNLQKLLCLYDKEKTGQISYIKFIELCEIFNINFERKKLKAIFDIYDKEKIGIILYDKLIQGLIKNISIDRVMLI
jgi:Ca2+-binding EF-hand superfamily protein